MYETRGTTIFKASLDPYDPTLAPPEQYNPIFNAAGVEGFKLIKAESLRFLPSAAPVDWCVAVLYRATADAVIHTHHCDACHRHYLHIHFGGDVPHTHENICAHSDCSSSQENDDLLSLMAQPISDNIIKASCFYRAS